jgi:hypothetical protein
VNDVCPFFLLFDFTSGQWKLKFEIEIEKGLNRVVRARSMSFKAPMESATKSPRKQGAGSFWFSSFLVLLNGK